MDRALSHDESSLHPMADDATSDAEQGHDARNRVEAGLRIAMREVSRARSLRAARETESIACILHRLHCPYMSRRRRYVFSIQLVSDSVVRHPFCHQGTDSVERRFGGVTSRPVDVQLGDVTA